MERPPYDPETKAQALATADVFGTKAAAKATGVNVRTVQRWREEGKTDPEILRLAEEMAAQAKPGLILSGVEILETAARLITQQLSRLAESEEPLPSSVLKDVTIVAGIWGDKLSAWAGWGEKDSKGRFGARGGPMQLVQVNNSLPAETPEQLLERLHAAAQASQAGTIEGQAMDLQEPAQDYRQE